MSFAYNLELVRTRITQAAMANGRNPSNITLLAVSKTQPVEKIEEALRAGQTDFGENYVSEALAKISYFSAKKMTWHFIGALQSNKTRQVAENFQWLHSLDTVNLAERLSRQRPTNMEPLNICVQIHLSNEESKNGCKPEDALTIASAVTQLPNLAFRGFMTLPHPGDRWAFIRLGEILHEARKIGLPADTLSMGMSGDMEIAIEEGATLVRVGTALFGPRTT